MHNKNWKTFFFTVFLAISIVVNFRQPAVLDDALKTPEDAEKSYEELTRTFTDAEEGNDDL